MKPSKHVVKNDDTGKFCVYNVKNKKVAEFDDRDDAVAYATKNHDSLMKEDAPANNVGSGNVDMAPTGKRVLKRFKDFK